MLKDYLSKLLALAMVVSFCAYSTAQNVTISEPANIAGEYPSIQAAFGPLANGQSGPVVLIDDGAGATTGCVAASNDLNGAVALIDRGTCGFTVKALNAQDAGAIAVIICNSLATFPDSIIVMGGSDGCALNIPAVMMSYGDCQTVRAELGAATVTATLPSNVPAAGQAIGAEIELPGAGMYTADVLTGPSIFTDSDSAAYYKITAAADGVMNVNSCLGGADTRVFVLQGCRNVLGIVGTNDDACEVVAGGPEYASSLDVIVYAGEEYIIVWDDLWEPTGFDFEVSFSDLPMVDVTVRVDMQDETVAPDGAHIAGSFNGWAGEPMTDNGDGTWSFTFTAQAGYIVEYKFQNGVGGWENNFDAATCGFNNNRFVDVGLTGNVAPLVCFNSCVACPPDVACPNWVKEDFEGFALGTIGNQDPNDVWTTWSNQPGSAEDGLVSATQAASGTQSLEISAAGGDDVVMDFGLRTSGNFILKWKMYVPAGFGAYYNIQKNTSALPNPATADFGIQVNMATNGSVVMDAGGAAAFTFTFPQDQWFDVYHSLDLDNNVGNLWVDGVPVATWELGWDIFNQTAGPISINGVDFYGNTGNLYFVDDVLLKEIESCAADAIICDGFDGYDLGAPGLQAPHWDTWTFDPGGPDDGAVVNEAQLSCEQSLKISAAGGDDVLLLLGDRTNGNYDLSWWMFVPTGSSAYYNTQKIEGNPGGEFGIQVDMDATGLATLDAGAAAAATFQYPHDEWFQMSHSYDLDNQVATISINGSLIYEFNPSWTSFTTTGTNQLGAVDFFGNTGNLYYVDDILFTGEEGMALPDVSVTFQVDMTWVLDGGGTINDIKIAGNFTTVGGSIPDWDPPSSPVFTAIGDDIYEVTIDFPATSAGMNLQYKFLNTADSWGDCGEEQECFDAASGGCTTGSPDFNRLLVIPDSDVAFCYTWETCQACNLPNATREALLDIPMTIAPNPFSNEAVVTFHQPIWDATARLTTLTGQLTRTYQVNGTQLIIEKNDLVPGVYFFNVVTEDGISTAKKLIVQ